MELILSKLIELGMAEEDAKAFIDEQKVNYVTVNEHNTLKAEMDIYKTNADSLNETIKGLEKEAGLSESLKLQLEDYKAKMEDKDNQIKKIKYDTKLEIALNSVNARNVRALRGLLDMDKIVLDENENITGLEEQIATLKETDGYLFAEDKPAGLGGSKTTPRNTAIKNPFSAEHFNITEQCRLMRENPVLAEQLRNLTQ